MAADFGEALRGLFSRNKVSQPPPDMRILPYDVRFALEHKAAMAGPKEIESLLHSGFTHEALYLTVKARDKDLERQKALLTDLVNVCRKTKDAALLNKRLQEEVKALPPDTAVQAGKLAQLSRQGFDYWDKLYEITAQDCATGSKTPVVVAYAPYTGLPHFFRNTPHMYLTMPSWITDSANPNCGYEINADAPEPVRILPKSEARPENLVFIDDTIKTGKEIAKVWKCWRGAEKPVDPQSIIVLDRVPTNSTA